MKKTYYLFALLSSLLCICSCSEDDNYTYEVPKSLDIVSSNLYFKSNGGTGTVNLNTSNALTAASSVDWCVISVSGNIVTTTVSENESRESRDGFITISDGSLKSQLTIHQEGLAISLETNSFSGMFTNEGGSTSIVIASSSPYKITIPESAQSWLTYTDNSGNLTFTCAKNATGEARAAQVILVSGSVTKVFSFTQYDEENLIGKWIAEYMNSEDVAYTTTVEIKKDEGGSITLILPVETVEEIYTFPCVYSNGFLNIKAASALGMYANTYYLYSAILSEDGKKSWDTAISYGGIGSADENSNFNLTFGDNGTWSGKIINGFGIWAFTSETLSSSSSSVGYLENIYDLVLHK